jgi:hypothetical protein
MQTWYDPASADGMGLDALRMMPHLCATFYEGQTPHDIDAAGMLNTVRGMTATIDQRCLDPSSDTPPDRVWTDGGMPRLLFTMVQMHVLSYVGKKVADPEFMSACGVPVGQKKWMTSWCSFVSAMQLYTHCVLGVQYMEQPSLGRLSRRLLRLLERDLKRSEDDMRTGTETTRDLWLWKAFVSAFYLAEMTRAGLLDVEDTVLIEVRVSLSHFLRTWSEAIGERSWADARKALKRVVWPTAYVRSGAAEAVWEEAMQAGVY